MSYKINFDFKPSNTVITIPTGKNDIWVRGIKLPPGTYETLPIELFSQEYIDKNYISKFEYNKLWDALAECETKRNNLLKQLSK